MKLIPLTNNQFAIVDNDDYDILIKLKWQAIKHGLGHYAYAGVNRIGMHRLIMNASKGEIIDHINHNGLDNRKQNLRKCSQMRNCHNNISRLGSTSCYLGVSWKSKNKKWVAQITFKYKKKYLGLFENQVDAAKKYDEVAMQLFGDFANLNFKKHAS